MAAVGRSGVTTASLAPIPFHRDTRSTTSRVLRLSDKSGGIDSASGDDHGDTPSEATWVALPSETAGAIDPAGDYDFFRFEVLERGKVVVYTTGDLDTYGVLLDSDLIHIDDDQNGGPGYNFKIVGVLGAGEYYVQVAATGHSSTGTYALRLETADSDDHGDARSDATGVALPSETTGEIYPWYDEDYFRFEVSERSTLVAYTTGDSDTTGTLYGSYGHRLRTSDDSPVGDNFFIKRELEAGTYYVRVSTHGDTGAYVLRLDTPGGDDHGDARSDATGVALPSETTGEIYPWYDEDYFRFEVSEHRDELLVRTEGDLDTLGTLYDSSGRVVETAHTGGRRDNFLIRRTVDAGEYYVRVSTYGKKGAYALRVGGDDHGDTRFAATWVALPSETTGFIHGPDDVDYFRFEVSSPSMVQARGTGALDTIGTLYDSAGTEIATNDGESGIYQFNIRRELSAGTYYFRVRGQGSEIGGYALRLSIYTDDDHGDMRSDATRIALPSETTAKIYPRDDVDIFRFEVSKRGTVAVYATGDIPYMKGVLYGVGGIVGLNDGLEDDGSLIRAVFLIRRELDVGVYYVAVYAQGGTGAYALHVETVDDDPGDTPSDATRVLLPSKTTEQIYPRDDVDIFRFEVSERGELWIALTGGGSLAILDSAELGFDHIADGTWIDLGREWLLIPDAGEYYVRVSGGTGAYTLHLDIEPVGTADHWNPTTQIALPSETTGNIYPWNDRDTFRFEVPKRGNVAIYTTGDLDTFGSLYVYFGIGTRYLDRGGGGGEGLNFGFLRILEAGTYYVDVESVGRGTTGAYTLHLATSGGHDYDDTRSGATWVELPSETTGQIYPWYDEDYFRFEVSSPGVVLARTTGLLDTSGALYDWTGTRIAADDYGDEYNQFSIRRELGAGTYYVRVRAQELKGGGYTLRLSIEPSGSYRRALGDFDGDGRDDVLLRHEDGRWYYYPMNGRRAGDGRGAANLTRNREWSVAGVGDFDGDGRDDVLLRKAATTGTWYYYPMNGRRHLAGHGAANLPSDRSWQLAGIGDFDGDGRDDVLLRNQVGGAWYFIPTNGDGQGAANLTGDPAWSVAGIGDFDGDGRDDVLLRKAATTGAWYFYPMDGRRHLAGHGAANLPSDRSWQLAGIGDFDGDRKDDVLLRHEDGRWHFYPMNGRLAAAGHGPAALTGDPAWSVAGIGDLNGDGKDDVLLRKPATGAWYYYPMDGREPLSGEGAANLTADLAWGGLFGVGGGDTTVISDPPGRFAITGSVVNFFTGAAVPNAAVELTQYRDDVSRVLGRSTSNADGSFRANADAIRPGRINVQATASGFASQSKVVEVTTSLDRASVALRLLPVQEEVSLRPTDDTEVAVEGQRVLSLPANSLVDANGSVVTDPVTARVTVLDPSAEPDVMPGDFLAIGASTGERGPIESYGAINVEFVNGAGQALNIGAGREATVSVPLADRPNPLADRRNPWDAPRTVPLYYWSDEMGLWVEEGEAALREISPGRWAYVGSVSRIRTWNAGAAFATTTVSGCVADADGNGTANARVVATGVDYIGRSETVADGEGRFDVAVRYDSVVRLTAMAGSQASTHTVRTGRGVALTECLAISQNSATITLTWGENPRDLDSHLVGPDGDGGDFHVYFGNSTVNIGNATAALEVDDTDSFGPEIVAISSFPFAGRYRYFVHHYGVGSGSILDSPARVEVNLGGDVSIFSPAGATGTSARGWAVFDIEVGEDLVPRLVSVQRFTDDNPVGEFRSGAVARTLSVDAPTEGPQRQEGRTPDGQRVPNPMSSLVEKKYYAK